MYTFCQLSKYTCSLRPNSLHCEYCFPLERQGHLQVSCKNKISHLPPKSHFGHSLGPLENIVILILAAVLQYFLISWIFHVFPNHHSRPAWGSKFYVFLQITKCCLLGVFLKNTQKPLEVSHNFARLALHDPSVNSCGSVFAIPLEWYW